ncbi:methionyl-tRNA formyltransferase [Suicoccus acidiformans]|uniref:Methionyl-tRNA formyltransferase n=1 Tax=Suicoccus acidiformans TaxID=2036206 RepID=A0A347WKI9_9LACT|nr:methionyl-tRNA formyltransferase [Suicoccus acidiformans]AXY25596.1 methionyl-tRNA formyltransferase [Suicoccus acidiformans]
MEKIIFMGTPQFAATILSGLLSSPYEVLAVVTQPDRPVGRKRVLTPSPVKELALEHDLPVYQPEKISGSKEVDELIALGADLIVTAAYGQFIPSRLIEAPGYSAINVHASLLPKYRGGAPIQYAVWNGDKETGISLIYMTKQMDAGNILAQAATPILPSDDSGTLFERLADIGRDLLLETLPQLFAGEVNAWAQAESDVVFSPTLTRAQEQIDWSQTATEIANHVRAFRPAPGTYTRIDDKRLKVWAGEAVTGEQAMDQSGEVGEVLALTDTALIVQAGAGSQFAITDWQESGKKRMTVAQARNGLKEADWLGQVFELPMQGDTHEA